MSQEQQPEQTYSREQCIEDGGHLWPVGAREDRSSACTRCGYDPGWVQGAVTDQHAERSNYRDPLTDSEGFQMGKPKINAIPGSNCCGKPQGCTNMNPGCVYLRHPYKRWVRGEITLEQLMGIVVQKEQT